MLASSIDSLTRASKVDIPLGIPPATLLSKYPGHLIDSTYVKQHRGILYGNARWLRSRPSGSPDPHVTAVRIFVVDRHMHTIRDDPE